MKKDNFEPKPFKPFVTMDDILFYKQEKPETRTASPVVNAVLDAIEVIGVASSARIARYLRLMPSKLWGAVEIATGLSSKKFLELILEDKLAEIECLHPELSSEEIAKSLGYSSRSALYNAVGKEWFDEQVSNINRKSRYAINRKGDKIKQVRRKKRWS